MNEFDHKDSKSTKEALLALRERAERRRHLITRAVDDHTPDAMQRLVQELQTYQIELEMQYEELLLAQVDAETARAEYADLYDFAPIGYLTLDTQGTIQQLNLTAAQLLGAVRQKLLRRRLALFVTESYRVAFSQFLDSMLVSEERKTCELSITLDSGQVMYVQLEGSQVVGFEDEVHFRLALLDVSARHTATQALALSEARFRQLFEQSADAVVLVRDFTIVDCNEAAMRMLGATDKSQMVKQPVSMLVPEYQPNGTRSEELIRQHYEMLRRHGTHRFEWYRRTFHGECKWLEIVTTYITVGGEQLVHAVWRDITVDRAARETCSTTAWMALWP
jgi:PAS domain S-box-containing protein